MDEASTERALVSMSTWMTELLNEAALLRGLVVSMALAIPREQLPEAERELLDDILESVP